MQRLYYIVADGAGFCWWSLSPTEDDSWRFFANGCVDPQPVRRAKQDGYRCVRVELTEVLPQTCHNTTPTTRDETHLSDVGIRDEWLKSNGE